MGAHHHVVVCLGQSLLDGGRVPAALDLRVKHAAEVYQRLASTGSASLYVSGNDVKGRGTLPPEGHVMSELLQRRGINAGDIDVDREANNTIENARNAIAYLRARGATGVTLVTSDFHSPRSAYIFRTVFSSELAEFEEMSFSVDPAPSGLAEGPPRPISDRPREINDWNFIERIEHETFLTQTRMRAWLLQYGYQSQQKHIEEASSCLRSLEPTACPESSVQTQSPAHVRGSCVKKCTLS